VTARLTIVLSWQERAIAQDNASWKTSVGKFIAFGAQIGGILNNKKKKALLPQLTQLGVNGAAEAEIEFGY
jgi:hypothetical protein